MIEKLIEKASSFVVEIYKNTGFYSTKSHFSCIIILLSLLLIVITILGAVELFVKIYQFIEEYLTKKISWRKTEKAAKKILRKS